MDIKWNLTYFIVGDDFDVYDEKSNSYAYAEIPWKGYEAYDYKNRILYTYIPPLISYINESYKIKLVFQNEVREEITFKEYIDMINYEQETADINGIDKIVFNDKSTFPGNYKVYSLIIEEIDEKNNDNDNYLVNRICKTKDEIKTTLSKFIEENFNNGVYIG